MPVSKPFEDASGDGYSQNYVLLRPHNIRLGSYSRKALFRFGNWCYEGEVDFGVDALHLGDVPDVLPALQKQQGQLAYAFDVGSIPSSSPYAAILRQFLDGTRFLQKEMVAVEPELQRLAETSETAWIDQDWAASFFEMQFHITDAMKVCPAVPCLRTPCLPLMACLFSVCGSACRECSPLR
jgi:hypothetical protein